MFDSMSLEQMRHYTGRREVPQDFDEYWKKLLEQYQTLPEYTIDTEDFNLSAIICESLWFKGSGNGRVYSRVIRPNSDQPVPVIFYFHGYQGSSPDWSACFNYVAAGYAVVAMDVRGQSGRSIDLQQVSGNTVKGQIIRGMIEGRDSLFFKDVFLDTYQLINIISEQSWADETQLSTYGASQGGALAIVAGALNDKISRIATIYPFLSDYQRILELGDMKEPYNELFRYFKFFDPYHETQEKILSVLDYIDVKNFASWIQVPVQMHVSIQDDICPPSTQFAIFNRIHSEKEVRVLQDYGHDALNVLVPDVVFNFLTGSRIRTTII